MHENPNYTTVQNLILIVDLHRLIGQHCVLAVIGCMLCHVQEHIKIETIHNYELLDAVRLHMEYHEVSRERHEVLL